MHPLRLRRAVSSTVRLAGLLGLGACAHAPGPREVALAYARALEENRLGEATALTDTAPEARAAFLTRYADAPARQARATQVRAALPGLRVQGPALTLVETGEGWRLVEAPPAAPPRPGDAPRACLKAFLDAVDAADWDRAWSLLASPLRERYTPERLHEDFLREPLAGERVRRARLVLAGPVQESEGGAEFSLGEQQGEQRAVRLTREPGGFRVAALE